MSKFALTVENLTKIYTGTKTKKQNKALNDLTFSVKQGEVFGPNTSPCFTLKVKSLSLIHI